MSKRELKAEVEIWVKAEVFEAAIATLTARIDELTRLVESMRRDVQRMGKPAGDDSAYWSMVAEASKTAFVPSELRG